MIYYLIPTPFLWCSSHKRPIFRVPDKMAKVFTSLPTSPLLLQGSHDEALCCPGSTADLFFLLLNSGFISLLPSLTQLQTVIFVSSLSFPSPKILRDFQVCANASSPVPFSFTVKVTPWTSLQRVMCVLSLICYL